MFAPKRRQAADERTELLIRAIPVDPGNRIVLSISVVVATLAVADLRAHRQHGNTARDEQQCQQIAHVACARRDHSRVVARALDALVPGIVLVAPVAIVFAVGFVVFARIGDEIGEGEAVVRDDVIDALGCVRPVRENVARAGDSCRKIAAQTRVAAPEASRRIAKAIVPFAPSGREGAELVAAGADVPRFRDQFGLRQHGVLRDRGEQGRARVEAGGAPAHRAGEIEPEPVDPATLHPAPQRGGRHRDIDWAVQREAVAATHIVDIARGILGKQPKIAGVIEAPERKRRTVFVAFAIVVEHDVEDRLHARLVQRVGRRAHFAPAVRREARIGRAEHDGIVAPGVGEAERGQVALVDESVGGHDFHGCHAERCEMRDDLPLREGGKVPTRRLGNVGAQLGEAAHVQFVNDSSIPRDARAPGFAARGFERDAFGNERAAVDAAREQRGMQLVGAIDRAGVGVGEQFRYVEAMAASGVERPVDTEAVTRARADARSEAGEDAGAVVTKRRARDFTFALRVIEAEEGGFAMCAIKADLGALGRQSHAQRRHALGAAHAAFSDASER